MTELAKLKSLSEWSKLRNAFESKVLAQMGTLPKERGELQTKVLDEVQFSGYTRRRVNYFIDEWERVSAWLFVPDGKEEVPAILCCHQATPHGKDEPAGLAGEPELAYARHYAEMGYVTLAPDCLTTGDRVSHGLEPFNAAAFYKENPRQSIMGKMLWDHMYAIDLLCETKRVDSARLGVVGHGLGAQNALFLVSFDERVQVCVASCGFTRLREDTRPDPWRPEDGLLCFPKLKDLVKKGEYPFDLEELLALAAPSPTMLITALNDVTIPNTKSCDKAVEYAKKVYKLLGAASALRNYTHTSGHRMPPDGLQESDEWFERWL
ncbi:MAG: dienelactone hydrolase family protein [Candidatus Hydrogenedentes bacterium]|nr:dienelactone hydrolase family protein [Candidatus Hydrogenedentota bacterium]